VTTSAIVACARVVAERVAGTTRCTTLRSSPPVTWRATPDGVYLVGSAAGPLGGDRLHIDVRVEAGASLVIRSAAATIALPGVTGAPSHLELDLSVAADATLWWLPEPLLLVDGCDHRARVQVNLDVDARLVMRDEVVLGRHDEPSGSLWQRTRVDRAGEPILRNDQYFGPRWPGADGPAGNDGARGVAQTLVVGGASGCVPDVPSPVGVRRATMRLRGDAVLVSELSSSAGLLSATRPALA
jgi:urease accessory protein